MDKFLSFRLIIIVLILASLACNNQKASRPVALDHVESEIKTVFHRMDSLATALSAQIAEANADSALIRKMLTEGYGHIQGVYENCFITPEGILKIIAPKDYHKVEGSDISFQDHIIKVRQTKKPMLSATFRAVEGFQAVALAYPILSPDDKLLGITVLLMQPESFLRTIITQEMAGIPGDIWVMQKDGTILYDFDQEEIGKNLFTDPLYQDYAESLRTAAKIAEEDKGMASYDFPGHGLETPVTNQAFWATVGMYGMDWKIVLTNPIGANEIHRTAATLGLKSAPQRLYEICNDETFQKALASDNRDVADRYFKEFYDAYPIYTIEWVDSTVTTRFGYPAQYSLENHQPTPDNTEQKTFYDAVVNREETTFEMRLLEGNTGIFRMYPVRYHGINLGSVYYLVLKR